MKSYPDRILKIEKEKESSQKKWRERGNTKKSKKKDTLISKQSKK